MTIREFIKDINVDRRNTLFALFMATFLLIGAVIWQNNEAIVDFLIEQQQERVITTQDFREVVQVNKQIDQRLDAHRQMAGALRVVIRRFHNGKRDLTTVPFEKVTDSYFSHSPSFQLQTHGETTVPLSLITRTLGKIWGEDIKHPTCFAAPPEEFVSPEIRSFYTNNEIKFVVICPLQNIGEYPMGLMEINLPYVPNEDQIDQIMLLTETESRRIAGYIDSIAIMTGEE